MTLVVIFDVDALANYNCLISCSTTTTTNGWELRLGNGPTDSRVVITRAGTNYNQYAASASNLLSAGSKNNFVAITYLSGETTPSAFTAGPQFNVNGVSVIGSLLTANPAGPAAAPSAPLYLGNRADGVTPLSGAILFAGIWNRALSFTEQEQIRANPWQLFAPPSRRIWIAEPSTGVITLTGLAASFTQTNVTPNISVGLTGVSATFAQGTVTPSIGTTVALTGVAATFAQGSLTPNTAKALTAVSATFAQGSLIPTSSITLAGVSATFAQGALTALLAKALTANSATFTQGTISASGTGTAALTAVSGVFSQVAPTPSITVALTGVSATFVQGSVKALVAPILSGVTGTFALGTLTPSTGGGSVTVALTGVHGVFSQGVVSPPYVPIPYALEPPPDSITEFRDVPWQQWFWKVWKAIKALQAGGAGSLPVGGTTGQVLTKNSATDGDAGWQTPSVGSPGALVLLEQHTASASASLDFTSFISSTYDTYCFEVIQLKAAAASSLQILVSTNGGATWDTTAAHYSYTHFVWGTGGSAAGGSTSSAFIQAYPFAGRSFDTTLPATGAFKLHSPQGTSFKTLFQGLMSGGDSVTTEVGQTLDWTGSYVPLAAFNAVRFIMASGNITSGTIRVYGVAK